jgi:ABC-type branched-subunit amino acid transport system ATPase component/ABC-type branched-subunit amino acid transport system permease subunit
MSVLVVTGLGGQFSLAQFAYAGIGAAVSIQVSADLGFIPGLLIGCILTGVLSVLLALPALRVQGLQLGVASLVFAVVTTSWLLDRDELLGNAQPPVRPDLTIAGISTAESRGYVWIALAVFLIVFALVYRLRRGAWGRVVVAVRDNADMARALSLSPTSVRLQTAAVGGLIAGLGGAVYGHAFSNLSAVNFPVQSSIDAVTATVIGGLGSLAGPLIGAAYLIGIPQLFTLSPEASTALAGAWLALIVHEPGGVTGVLSAVARRFDPQPQLTSEPTSTLVPAAPSASPTTISAPAVPVTPDASPLLIVRGVTKRYGGATAVNDVSFEVHSGEIVGLIGPNGAGKTTLFEIVSGFVRPDAGSVTFRDHEVTGLSPEARSRLGMARSFQSAALFPTLSLTEAVMVATERTMTSSLIEAFGSHRREHQREDKARSLIQQFGLHRYADAPVATLPTGTRRLAELICAVALEPKLILLDEPSAGIAHTETDRLAASIESIRSELGITMVIIEHDLPMLAALSDRMIAMEVGTKIAEGQPNEVRAHPDVVASYVGAEV